MIYAATIRLARKLTAWLQVQTATRLIRLAGKMNGPPDLSSRKGFSRRWDRRTVYRNHCRRERILLGSDPDESEALGHYRI